MTSRSTATQAGPSQRPSPKTAARPANSSVAGLEGRRSAGRGSSQDVDCSRGAALQLRLDCAGRERVGNPNRQRQRLHRARDTQRCSGQWGSSRSHAVCSPQSNGMAKGFINTFKRDRTSRMYLRDTPTVLAELLAAFEHFNELHPHSGLRMMLPTKSSIAAESVSTSGPMQRLDRVQKYRCMTRHLGLSWITPASDHSRPSIVPCRTSDHR
ncbi:hypothetical protein CTI10_012755 [Delftia acidovorans]|uniref:Integrase catalytic domain-containing protein n=1 Tax=Chryseobacterium sp. B5 TaxID=2050562 RepID=A0A2G7T6U8_9FLAO|nr:hypothetical protein CTI10_012755 [Delftia acidovorans]